MPAEVGGAGTRQKAVAVKDAQTIREEDLLISGRTLRVYRGGAGPGILLLHSAWGDAAMSWSGIWEELAMSFTVLAPDIPGFGLSGQLPAPTLSLMAKTLGELLKELKPGKMTVVGNSFGGAVARQFASEFPESVSRLVLVNGGHIPHMPFPVRKILAVPFLERRFRRLMSRFSFSPQALEKSFVNPASLPPAFFEGIQRSAPEYSRIVFDTFMNITKPLPVPSAPTFLIWGAQDGLTPLSQAKAIRKKIQGSVLISIEGAGHMPQVERPREFLMALRSAGGNPFTRDHP